VNVIVETPAGASPAGVFSSVESVTGSGIVARRRPRLVAEVPGFAVVVVGQDVFCDQDAVDFVGAVGEAQGTGSV